MVRIGQDEYKGTEIAIPDKYKGDEIIMISKMKSDILGIIYDPHVFYNDNELDKMVEGFKTHCDSFTIVGIYRNVNSQFHHVVGEACRKLEKKEINESGLESFIKEKIDKNE